MIVAVLKLIIFTSMAKRIINTGRNERVTLQIYDTCLQMFDVCTLSHSTHLGGESNSCHTLISKSGVMVSTAAVILFCEISHSQHQVI